jgi:pseudouridine synthase
VKERLQKAIASAGICSRREAERLITEGEVRVNNETIRRQGVQVDLAVDRVEVLGRRIRAARAPIYVALHKPRGYVTTVKDPEGRSTVMELVQRVGERIFPVGRLDYTAEGLLLMTNDGALAYALMRPGGAPKTYRVKVKGTPAPDALDKLRRGVSLDGRALLPARVHLESRGETAWLRVTLHEGKKNQIVRMMDLIGHPVRRLRRLSIGPVQLAALPAGKWRFLTPEEIVGLRAVAGLAGDGVAAGSQPSRPRHRAPGARPRPPVEARRGVSSVRGLKPPRGHASRGERTSPPRRKLS